MMLKGKHLIAGAWLGDAETFENMPVAGAADRFAVGRPTHVDWAVVAAEAAFASYGALSREARASFLRAITEIGTKETGLADADLGEAVFGPLGLIVEVADAAQMPAVAESLQGQLSCTLHLETGNAGDTDRARAPMQVLTRKAGRILANGFSTGVDVADVTVIGGPYPASTNVGATSVGTLSVRLWLRSVCYQNITVDILPVDLT